MKTRQKINSLLSPKVQFIFRLIFISSTIFLLLHLNAESGYSTGTNVALILHWQTDDRHNKSDRMRYIKH